MSQKTHKIWLNAVIGLILVGLLVYTFIPNAQKVDLITVSRGDVVITLDGEGKTRIRDIYAVSAPINGRVMRIESKAGDRVIAGETIIAVMTPIDPSFLDKRSETQARAGVQEAEAAMRLSASNVNSARASLDFAEAEYQRAHELYQKGNIAIARLQQAELQLKMRKAEVATARAEYHVMESRLAAAQAQLLQPNDASDTEEEGLCQLCVHAPIDGTVLRILHESEGVIATGTPLVEVGNPENLEIVIEMLSRYAVQISPGDMALIKRWGGSQDIWAKVRLVEPSGYTKISALGVEEQRVNVILDFIDPLEKWRTLGDAFRVEASIIVDKAENVLNVPVSALFRHEEQWSVFVVKDKKATLQQVVVGRKNDRDAEIVEGLSANDQVIIHPGNTVSAGTRVVQRQ